MHYGALPKKTSIKGQPHELSYITPQEAGVLRMLGGSGENFNGVPAYNHIQGHGTSIAAGYGQMADTLSQAPGGAVSLSGKKVGDRKDRKPKKTEQKVTAEETQAGLEAFLASRGQTPLQKLQALFANGQAQKEMDARAEAEKATATSESGNVSPTSTVQMKDGKVLVSTNVGNTTENTYLDPETYTAMTGYEPPSGVNITSSDNVSSPMLDATKPTDTTGFVEDLMLAGQDIGQLFDPSLGNLMGTEEEQGARALGSGVDQSYFVPGVALGDPDRSVMAESAGDAFNMVDMDRFDNIQSDDPLFDIDPANVLTEEDLFNMRGEIDPVTGNVDSGGQGNYGDDVSVPYDYYGAPFGLGYDDNGNLIEIPLGDGITIPGTDITITAPPTDDGGGGAPPSGGSFSKKRDVYGNPIRLTKGGASWWKMAANWMNPSERIDTYVTVDEEGNYITSDGKIVPEDLLATAMLTPTDRQIKTGTEEYQVPFTGISNMPTDYFSLYNGEINQEPLPVIRDQEFIPASETTFKP